MKNFEEKKIPSYYAIIPANIRYDSRLMPNAKLLYGEITALSNKKGCCWATNNHFAKLYNVSKKSISNWVSQLEKYGYISVKLVYKDCSKIIDNRSITISTPMEQKVHTPMEQKVHTPMEQKVHTPMEQKVKVIYGINNTSINNTSINNTSINKENSDFGFLKTDDISKEQDPSIPKEFKDITIEHYKSQLDLYPNQAARKNRLAPSSIKQAAKDLHKISIKFGYDTSTIKEMLEFSLTNDFWVDKTVSLLYSNLTKIWGNGETKIDCLHNQCKSSKKQDFKAKYFKQTNAKTTDGRIAKYGAEHAISEL